MLKSLLNSLDSTLIENLEGIQYTDNDTVEIEFAVQRTNDNTNEYVTYVATVFDTGEFSVTIKHLFADDCQLEYVDREDIKILDRLEADIHYWVTYHKPSKEIE